MSTHPGFNPISLIDYVELYMRSNPGTDRAELVEQLEYAIAAFRRGVRCQCGAPFYIIGSSQAGLACFSCITQEAAINSVLHGPKEPCNVSV